MLFPTINDAILPPVNLIRIDSLPFAPLMVSDPAFGPVQSCLFPLQACFDVGLRPRWFPLYTGDVIFVP